MKPTVVSLQPSAIRHPPSAIRHHRRASFSRYFLPIAKDPGPDPAIGQRLLEMA